MNQSSATRAHGPLRRHRALVDTQVVERIRRKGVRLPELGIGIAVILMSVVGSLWWQSRGAGSNRVALAARELNAGDVIEIDDVAIASVSSDDRLALIEATQVNTLIGSRAVTDIEAGTPLNRGQLSTVRPLGRSESLVGVIVDAARAPIELAAGDVVDVVALDRDLSGLDVVSSIVTRVEVWSVSMPEDVLDERSVTLRIPASAVDSFVGHDEIHLMKVGV